MKQGTQDLLTRAKNKLAIFSSVAAEPSLSAAELKAAIYIRYAGHQNADTCELFASLLEHIKPAMSPEDVKNMFLAQLEKVNTQNTNEIDLIMAVSGLFTIKNIKSKDEIELLSNKFDELTLIGDRSAPKISQQTLYEIPSPSSTKN